MSQAPLKRRKWTDDRGLDYELPIKSHGDLGEAEASEAARTGDSFASVEESVDKLFENIRALCRASERIENSPLKQVMRDTFYLWKGVRTRSAIRARLRHCFEDDTKGRKDGQKALLCLCRIYHCVCTFVEAAEKLPLSDSFEVVPVPYQRLEASNPGRESTSPTLVAKRLGLTFHGNVWANYLARETSNFAKLVRKKRRMNCVHAEIRAIHYHTLHLSCHAGSSTHTYIGCSKLCCLLCYWFIRWHGQFTTRGSHETIFHLWDLPMREVGEDEVFMKATARLLNTVLTVLRDLSRKPRPPTGRDLLAQSSAALSSAQIIVEKESAPLERPKREME